MATSENKTKPTQVSPEEFLATLDEARASDGLELMRIMHEVTGEPATMWGPSIIGFGSYHYKYESGREGDSLKVGFSPRKAAIVLYGLVFYDENEPDNKLLDKLGPVKRGKGCVYLKRLSDVDEQVLRTMIANAYNKDKG